jgi:nicotinamide-nucleotide amidase
MAMGDKRTPQAGVIAIGSELLLGEIVDTNSAHLGKELARAGIPLSSITAVGDDLNRIVEALRIGLARSDVLVTTGGLGPTEDDLTREAVAMATGQKLVFHQQLMEEIEAVFTRRGFRMASNNRKQAYIPEGASAIKNPIGTAPGFILEDPRGVIISLPGVPRELEYLLDSVVIPYLRKKFKLGRQAILSRVLRVCGLGESGVDTQIGDLIRRSENPRIGLLASPGDIRICLICQAKNRKEAGKLIDPIEQEIRNRLGPLIYGVDNETLERKVVGYLTRLNLRLAVADAFTGGLLCQKILATGTPRFVQGFVLPSKKGQMSFLGLPSRDFSALFRHQEAYSVALARRILDHADVVLALTGRFRMSDRERVGTLAVALAEKTGHRAKTLKIGGPPESIIERASIIALDMLRNDLLEKCSFEK